MDQSASNRLQPAPSLNRKASELTELIRSSPAEVRLGPDESEPIPRRAGRRRPPRRAPAGGLDRLSSQPLRLRFCLGQEGVEKA